MVKFEYRITKLNEFKNGWSVLLYLLIFSLLPLYILYRDPEGDIMTIVAFAAGGFLCTFIPMCILHLKYYSLDEGKVMLYEPNELKITISDKKKGEVSEFTLDDIKGIFHTMTLPMAEKRMHWFPWDSYNYSEIYLNNGKKHIITSLMVYKLELPVGDKYEVITSFYPYPKG